MAALVIAALVLCVLTLVSVRVLLWLEEIEAREGIAEPQRGLSAGSPDERGQVARPVAEGVAKVADLAREIAKGKQREQLPSERPLSESRIERGGLRAGSRAPGFRLPAVYGVDVNGCDVDGRMVSLEEYRGREVLLVFTDPGCGPCDTLAGKLARFYREYGGRDFAVLMVARGDHDENRRKAQHHGIEFPVLIQEKWRLSREYGIFATPVAFLIDRDGAIARDVAQGANTILSLAREATSGRTQTMKEENHEQAQLV